MSASSISIATFKTFRVAGHYRTFCALTHRLRSPFLLFVRLYWGWQFLQTGWGKLHNLSHVTEFFASLGIPAPGVMAPFIASLEFFGGILLIAGLATRLIGLLLAGNMLVAYIASDRMALGAIFSDPGKFYAADPFTFLFASLLVLIFGAGIFSIDALIDRTWVEPKTLAAG
ncbi:MAG TPA: DoxX family protein [Acidobacteriaceae bacterium]|nr:DoxX family protein [Acidobacteriaceae bacterium]